jgi:hypothetical protein
MNVIEKDFSRRGPGGQCRSVLDGPEYIRGLPHDKKSSVEEAREHPDEAKACKSVLDGPACIVGMPNLARESSKAH